MKGSSHSALCGVLTYMDELKHFIDNALEQGVYKIVLSGPRPGANGRRIVLSRLENEFFAERLTEKQAFHSHIPREGAADEIMNLFSNFTQINAWNGEYEFTARLSKHGKLLTGRHACASSPKISERQDREKSYLLGGRPSSRRSWTWAS